MSSNFMTSINLDEETSEIAKRLTNRSEFVRECLRRWNAFDLAEHVHPNETDKCMPLTKKGCCILCWPHGPPTKADWLYYRETGGTVVTGRRPDNNPNFAHGQPYANSWVEQKAIENNRIPDFPIPQGRVFKIGANTPPSEGNLAQKMLKRLSMMLRFSRNSD